MRAFTLFLISLNLTLFINAQGTLQFNRVLLLGNSLETVPAGKVWKVTAGYGIEQRINECINYSQGSTHEIGERVRCSFGAGWSTGSFRATYSIRSLIINGQSAPFLIDGFANGSSCSSTQTTNNCTGGTSSCFDLSRLSCVNLPPDPQSLPLWLPAGTTLQTSGPNTHFSVLEFNIIP
jgi:hypothetical protein